MTEDLIQFIISPQLEGLAFLAKVIFIIFSALLFIGVIVFFRMSSWWRRLATEDMAEFLTFRPYGMSGIEKTWKKVLARLETGLESEYKLAIMEADSLLEDSLQRMGYRGENLEEKMNLLTPVIIPNLEEVKEVHRIRDSIVQDPDYKLSLDDAKKLIDIYEKALRNLQAL